MEKLCRTMSGSVREQRQHHAIGQGLSWERVLEVVESVRKERWANFRDQHGDWGRDLALFLGRKDCGLPLGTLGLAVGGLSAPGVSPAIRRFSGRLATEKPLRRAVEKAKQMLIVNA